MDIYDNLNRVFDSCHKDNRDWNLVDISYNYEYFTGLISAYIVNENITLKNDILKYYKDPKPTFGVIFNRFRIIYDMDKNIKSKIEKIDAKRFLKNVKKLYTEISKFDIENEVDISKLNDKNVHTVIINLLKIVVYLRNEYLHERMLVLDKLSLVLKDVYRELMMLTNALEISRQSEFVRVENDEIIFLNTITPQYTYKDINYKSVVDSNLKDVFNSNTADNKENNYEEVFIKDIPFIKVPSGTIRFKSYDSNEFIDYYVDGFCISKYPITNKQFLEFLKRNKQYAMKRYKNEDFMKDYRNYDIKAQDTYSNCAVYFIDWMDAINYCNSLSEQYGYSKVYCGKKSCLGVNGFRLPTELEWYYAATCGKGINADIPDLSKIIYRRHRGIKGKVDINSNLYENEWKISGMLGNINEWTNSTTKKLSIKKFEAINNIKDRRIIKGGSFASDKNLIRYDYSTDVNIDNLHYIGLRVVINSI